MPKKKTPDDDDEIRFKDEGFSHKPNKEYVRTDTGITPEQFDKYLKQKAYKKRIHTENEIIKIRVPDMEEKYLESYYKEGLKGYQFVDKFKSYVLNALMDEAHFPYPISHDNKCVTIEEETKKQPGKIPLKLIIDNASNKSLAMDLVKNGSEYWIVINNDTRKRGR